MSAGAAATLPAHEAYDPVTDRWTTLANVPTPRDYLAVAATQGRLYALGGRIDGSYARKLATNEAYASHHGPLGGACVDATARSGIAAAVLDGRIVVVGGEAPSGTFNQVEAYDAGSNSWSSYPRMPTAPTRPGRGGGGRKMYVISGGPMPGGSSSAANEVFAP